MDKARPKDFITLRQVDQISAFKIGYYSSFPISIFWSFCHLMVAVMAYGHPEAPSLITAIFAMFPGVFIMPFVIGSILAIGISIKNSITPWRSAKVILKIDGVSQRKEGEG